VRIRSLEIASFRKFTDGIRISGFGDGLNILVAPNEYGKSTIVAALRGLVFEKYRAKTEAVRRMQTLGSETSPTLALDFDLAGGSYRLEKRFLHRQASALLSGPGGRRFENDEAEEELQRLLGFREPGKQGATEESRGIWGLLWLEQGQSFARPELSETGRGAIRECLEQEVGALAGGERGTRIRLAVETAIRTFLDGRGKPAAEWKGLLEKISDVEASLLGVRETRRQLTADLDALDTLRSDRKALATDGEDERLGSEIAQLGKDVEASKLSEAQLGEAKATLAVQESWRDAADKEILGRQAQGKEIEAAVREADEARPASEEARRKTIDLRTRRDGKGLEERTLGDVLITLREEETRLAQQRKLFECRNTLSGLQEALDKATAAAESVDDLEARALAISVTPAALQDLKQLEGAMANAQANRDALATRVVFSLESGAIGRVHLGGAPTPALHFESLLTSPTRIDIDGVGQIEIRPGAKDMEDADRALQQAREALRARLAKLEAESVVDAEGQLQKKKDLQGDVRTAKTDLATLTRERTLADGSRIATGLEALKKHVNSLRAATEELEARGVQLPAGREELDAAVSSAAEEVHKVEKAIALARTRKDDLASLLEDAVHEETKRSAAVQDAEHRAQLARQRLATRRETEGDEDLVNRREKTEADRMAAEAAVRKMEKAGTDREPLRTLEARLTRLETTRKGRQERRQKIELDIARLETSVSTQQGAGIDETIERKEADLGALQTEKALGERRLDALQLLAVELRKAEAEARERYLAPVTQRVQPYLAALLPGAQVRCSERLELEAVERGGISEDLDILSDGTREQIAVLTRLAFADLLLGSGRPAAVILDDALAFSDAGRLERMFDILTEASKKVQITVFSCRERAFERLGANVLVVEPLHART
jgi:energy-coupling factor transporter ATP-binding protein EcfA2